LPPLLSIITSHYRRSGFVIDVSCVTADLR
jgi:hypothetical protein